MKKLNIKDFYFIFDDYTTSIILDYIRNNYYSKYPYKSLSQSSLLSKLRVEQERVDIEYLTLGASKIKHPYKHNTVFKVWFDDNYLGESHSLEIKAYDSKKSKEYLILKKKQLNKFQ